MGRRSHISFSVTSTLAAADRIIAVLDRMDGDDNGDAEPSLGAPENHHGSQIVWLRGTDRDLEVE